MHAEEDMGTEAQTRSLEIEEAPDSLLKDEVPVAQELPLPTAETEARASHLLLMEPVFDMVAEEDIVQEKKASVVAIETDTPTGISAQVCDCVSEPVARRDCLGVARRLEWWLGSASGSDEDWELVSELDPPP